MLVTIHLLVPLPSYTTSLACSVPQVSPQSRTSGLPNRPTNRRLSKAPSTLPLSSSPTTTLLRTRPARGSSPSSRQPRTVASHSRLCRRRLQYTPRIPAMLIGCSFQTSKVTLPRQPSGLIRRLVSLLLRANRVRPPSLSHMLLSTGFSHDLMKDWFNQTIAI